MKKKDIPAQTLKIRQKNSKGKKLNHLKNHQPQTREGKKFTQQRTDIFYAPYKQMMLNIQRDLPHILI